MMLTIDRAENEVEAARTQDRNDPKVDPFGLAQRAEALAEQHRIADLLDSVDASADAGREEEEGAIAVLASYLAERLDAFTEGADRVTVGDKANVTSGISWSRDDEVTVDTPEAIGVVGVANIQRDYASADVHTWLRPTPQALSKLVMAHTILTIRTNGNAERIGNMHLAPPGAVGLTLSSFITAITTNKPGDAAYLLRILQAPQSQRAITEATSGSTGLKNLAVSWLRDFRVPWPGSDQRSDLVRKCGEIEAVIVAARARQAELRTLREALLEELLSARVTIRDSYDRFLATSNHIPAQSSDLVAT